MTGPRLNTLRCFLADHHGDLIRSLSAQGKTVAEICIAINAAGTDCLDATVRSAMILMGLSRTGNKMLREDAQKRIRFMVALYRDGYTLEQIGQQYGITRERVRQLMTKYEGIRAHDGGQHIRAAKKRSDRGKKADAASFRRWGCTVAQRSELLRIGTAMMAEGQSFQRTPTGAWARQRQSARHRKIGWELSLWDWWQIWQQSGKWESRGRTQDDYVMARLNDEGPYAVGNVSITTVTENLAGGRRKKKYDWPRGVHKASNWRADRPRFTAHRRIRGVLYYLGSHPSPELAHAAYLSFVPPLDVAA